MRVDELDFELPGRLVATAPARPRDAARLMVVRAADGPGGPVEHRQVRDLPELLAAGDRLVVNRTSVAAARLIGRKAESGGRVEGLFLRELRMAAADDAARWRVLLKGGRLRAGVAVELQPEDEAADPLVLELVERDAEAWVVRVRETGPAAGVLHRVGRTPLPPYILAARRERDAEVADAVDRRDYETVFADGSARGSVAAPTAGLHFTPELLDRLAGAGVSRHEVVLHVGEGTFRPVTAESLDQHAMHAEWYAVPPATLDMLREHHADPSGRIIAVGTTSVRTLESLPATIPLAPATSPEGISGETDILIAPGWTFRHVGGMLTNFHLPRSTLLALVAARIGLERTLELYRLAVAEEYRFYSYGDAMLILP